MNFGDRDGVVKHLDETFYAPIFGDMNVLERWLLAEGVSPTRLAKRAGLSVFPIYAQLGGRVKWAPPLPTTIAALAEATGIAVEVLETELSVPPSNRRRYRRYGKAKTKRTRRRADGRFIENKGDKEC